jgi:peptidoglycan/xylan/chitin deacetylase (PgdA/CDA1 family)
MVRFGDYTLPHVLEAQIQTSRVEIERAIPYRDVAYRADQTTRGRTVRVNGEIRSATISGIAFTIELLRRLSDDTARILDLEDGTTSTFNAKLTDPAYLLDTGEWVANDYRVPYSVTMLEVT